jgi:starvation-inducible outer membrane lipoprotein
MNKVKALFLSGLFLLCSCAQSPDAKEKKNPTPNKGREGAK